ncbi:MAG: type II toxin-antitoxin system RelE/ParE family toxin [Desulfobacteraceae bacterium]|nr:type II toxin-antitoxin system RelE/ParE family toxin [Desulfobacteraceae bacterium]
MPRLIVTEGAARGLERCRSFLAEKNPNALKKAAQTIGYHFSLLEKEPEIGRPLGDMPELRELIIPFGESGYVALYRFENDTDSVNILSFRHQKEAGYHDHGFGI